MVKLKNDDVSAVSVDGIEYKGSDGIFEVPETIVAVLVESHGFVPHVVKRGRKPAEPVPQEPEKQPEPETTDSEVTKV